jgi:hypothetical protein
MVLGRQQSGFGLDRMSQRKRGRFDRESGRRVGLAPDSPSPGEGRTPEWPGQTKNISG